MLVMSLRMYETTPENTTRSYKYDYHIRSFRWTNDEDLQYIGEVHTENVCTIDNVRKCIRSLSMY